VGFIPEDRHEDAVMLERSLTENLALRGAGARRGLVDWTAVRERTQALLGAYDVRAASPEVRMRQLSGGNQQKVVLARELSELSPADAVVAENPTRGLDVRATADIHARLRAARDNGTAVILYSSDLDEVLALADRMLVIHAGTVRELALDRETIGRAMLGLA
jgi:simple sugar transport system ATP-binding protein